MANSFVHELRRVDYNSTADPEAFYPLPLEIVNQIGYSTHQGPRIEAVLLSSFAYYYKERVRSGKDSTGPHRVPLGRHEFVTTIQQVAMNAYAILYGKEPKGPAFKRFYVRARKSVDRLIDKGLLIKVRPLVPKAGGVFGTIWSLEGTPLEGLLDICESFAAPCDEPVLRIVERYPITFKNAA